MGQTFTIVGEEESWSFADPFDTLRAAKEGHLFAAQCDAVNVALEQILAVLKKARIKAQEARVEDDPARPPSPVELDPWALYTIMNGLGLHANYGGTNVSASGGRGAETWAAAIRHFGRVPTKAEFAMWYNARYKNNGKK
ncbi:MAG TPA: hypothetical protein PLS95_01000 [Thermoanaerobaculales bacterium]|jgi:hypothetical protein|nr:hypothetical protein [Thermoanaerobaculales bacterium]